MGNVALLYLKFSIIVFKSDLKSSKQACLLEEGSFDSAIDACDGVFHTACPVAIDPQVNMIPYTFFFHL